MENGSILLTSNKTFTARGQTRGDEVLATSILDHLPHHREVVAINNPGRRLKNRPEAIETEVAAAG
jgi:DNA replication protein DnaC